MSTMARRLSIRCLRVVAVPHTLRGDQGRCGGVMLDVFGPEQPGKLTNYMRALEVANDGGRWVFEQSGEPFPFEQVEQYLPLGSCAWLIQKTGPFTTVGHEYTLEQARAAHVL